MQKGNPRCGSCHGSGVVQTAHGRAVCVCVRGTALQRQAIARMHSIGAPNPAGDAVRRALAEREERIRREKGNADQ